MDMEEVVKWDLDLRLWKTFQTAVLILSSRKFRSPNLESLQKILVMYVGEPTFNYFKWRSP
jgi:hypothetical protein